MTTRTWLSTLVLAIQTACAQAGSQQPVGASEGAPSAPGFTVAALEDGLTTIPYGGYVDFDGEPVNAGSVEFNFALFPCATPGPGPTECQPVWVARGTWNEAPADWKQGWPTGAGSTVGVPIFSGRFAVELGATGQNPLPDPLTSDLPELYLAIQIEGRALATVQKLVTARRATVSTAAIQAHPDEDFVVPTARVVDSAGIQLTIPSGAVMAFNRDECPPGWSPFAPAAGRTIVGVNGTTDNGLTARELGAENGAETYTLGEDQMPHHGHALGNLTGHCFTNSTGGLGGGGLGSYRVGNFGNGDCVGFPGTAGTGGSQPFPIEPPAVVLLYCEKE